MIENEDHDRDSMELPGQQAQLLKDAITFSGTKVTHLFKYIVFFSIFQILNM